jgi:putative transposase
MHVLREGNHEHLRVEINTSRPGDRVVTLLDPLVPLHGAPERIHCDNGPEFASTAVADCAARHRVTLAFIQPGQPNQSPTSNASTGRTARKCSTLGSSVR